MLTQRTPWQITRSVWYALYMRELLARVINNRFAWFWMVFEPLAFIAIMVAVRVVVFGREKVLINADFIPWLIVGLLSFFLFREQMIRLMGAVTANKALYAYRQVKPVDTVFVRSGLEGLLKTFVFSLFIVFGLLLAIPMWPQDWWVVLYAWLSLWALGFGIGLTLSVLATMVEEVGIIFRMLTLPLLLISGVIIPLTYLPHHLVEYLLYNPIVHGIETIRLGFYPDYHTVQGITMQYLWYWALSTTALGLILHLRFEAKLKTK
ncbi:ABC transporter permease [Thiomicrospira microaerophila]|uniref:ABC transporter permease n=1 Tax=Thiomicrospira microaerophila TaxID=406020 RepID=UPI0005C87E4C|nr:ABC transporter permease [Thiomicrospira microaerophila]